MCAGKAGMARDVAHTIDAESSCMPRDVELTIVAGIFGTLSDIETSRLMPFNRFCLGVFPGRPAGAGGHCCGKNECRPRGPRVETLSTC